jgi:hypothetical protein
MFGRPEGDRRLSLVPTVPHQQVEDENHEQRDDPSGERCPGRMAESACPSTPDAKSDDSDAAERGL